MIASEREAFAAALSARLAELDALEAENARARAVVELDQQSVGRLARMDAMERQAIAKAAHHQRLAERKRIAAALKRIDEDAFGWCADCGEAIAPGRLALDPTVALCAACADQR